MIFFLGGGLFRVSHLTPYSERDETNIAFSLKQITYVIDHNSPRLTLQKLAYFTSEGNIFVRLNLV